MSALQKGVSNPTVSNPPNNGATSESDDDDQRKAASTLWNLAPRRGRWASENGEDVGEPKEALRMVYQVQCIPTHPFHRQLHSNWLCGSTQLINIIILYILRYLAPHNSPNSTWRRSKNQETADWIPWSSSQGGQCQQQNTGSSSYHCCSQEACWTSQNLIGAGEPALPASHSSDVPAPLSHPLPFAWWNLMAAEGWNWQGVWVRCRELALSWCWCCMDREPVDVFVWRGCLLSRNLSACPCPFCDMLWWNLKWCMVVCFHWVYTRSLPSSLEIPSQRVSDM